MPTSDELGGQTFSGFQEHPFEAATVQKTLLYSVLNLRIKLAVIFPSPNQAMLRLVFFFLIQKKKKIIKTWNIWILFMQNCST